MAVTINLRFVKDQDAQSLLEIYAPIVLNTSISFETEVPTPEAFKVRIEQYSTAAPWLVAEIDNLVVGYAYATAHRSRGAYRWSQETTVYVHPDFRKMGVARALYSKLLELLKHMGYTKALGVITIPNEASIGFHQRLGFQHIGEMKNIGFKFNRWHTTSWWDLDLQANDFIPGEIKSVESIRHLLG